MATIMFIAHIFKKNNTHTHPISSAISDGITDTFREMGYKYDDGWAKEKNDRESRIDSSGKIHSTKRSKN
jgi:hypothetical protein